jgi:hypothetical protein
MYSFEVFWPLEQRQQDDKKVTPLASATAAGTSCVSQIKRGKSLAVDASI